MPLKVLSAKWKPFCLCLSVSTHVEPGLDIKHLVYMPVGHMYLNVYMPCKNFHVPSQYFNKPCKGYVHCWENKYMLRLKNYLPCRAHNHNGLCALRQDLHAPGMWARLNVKPWEHVTHMCQLTRPSLVLLMVCSLFGAKPFFEPMLSCHQWNSNQSSNIFKQENQVSH